MSRDLTCAFQPNRVIVPSFGFLLTRPEIPKNSFADTLEFLFARIVLSSMAWIRPAPNRGVGIRKIRLLFASAALKSGWAMLHPTASVRPVMVTGHARRRRGCRPG